MTPSGEIDIIEGVNDQDFNAMTLHTGSGCSISENTLFSGKMITSNCDVNAPDQYKNSGCSIDADGQTNTYGSGLNSIDGGVYAMEWTASGISTYFFPRSSLPSDITSGKPKPTGWGKPLSHFSGSCDFSNTMKDQQIIFDTTFCGDWAGNAWSSSSCAAKASSCNDYVANNPSAFTNAYWEINSLKVYQDNREGDSASSTDAGPTGIATSLPAVVSSLAPIPESSGPASVVSLSNIGGWANAGNNAYAAAVTPAVTPAVVAAAAATPTANVVTQAITAIGHPDWVWTTLITKAVAPAVVTSVVPAAVITAQVTTTVAAEASWFAPGSEGIPEDDVNPARKEKRSLKTKHKRHLLKHARKMGARHL